MPERTPTNKPTVLVGSTIESGVPNTGQSLWTLGGTRTHTVFSGTAGGDANIWVGGGRLDSFAFTNGNQLALSGQQVIFYDSAVAVSGGPLATSGHKHIGTLGVPMASKVAASGDVFIANGTVQTCGFVFTSGLCFQSRSGIMAWSASYTPVVSGASYGG